MNDYITINFNQFLLSASLALDAVEQEVLGAVQNHSKRVAYMSVKIGKEIGFSKEEQSDIAAYASLHDNALTEYITSEKRKGNNIPVSEIRENFKFHCIAGEKNISVFPFLKKQDNIILYHHENYDGSGMFGIKGENIPLMSRIIRIADDIDVKFPLLKWNSEKYKKMINYLKNDENNLYDKNLIEPLCRILTEETAKNLSNENIGKSLNEVIPVNQINLSYQELIKISSLFAHIIDYKSPFTLDHSVSIAAKTKKMAEYYEFDYKTANEIYIAAYLHDIGKLAVPDALLEKPGKLTDDEFEVIKKHVFYTHKILSAVDSFKDIERWASSHHEKLDGSGYFRGNKGSEQDFCSRLLTCIDIYQALVEERPYRKGMDKDTALKILREQAQYGKIDNKIVEDIAKVL